VTLLAPGAVISRAPSAVAGAAHTRHLAQAHFPALDGVRGVAILAVLWHHALPAAQSGWLGRGHVGVRLFFALSGFLITSRLLAERRGTGSISLSHFWLRRALRIFPLYYLVLGLFALYLGLRASDAGSRHFFDNLLFHASYTSNWFVDYAVAHPVWFAFGWSLATEEQFYAWWPPLLRRRLLGGALALAGLLALQQLAAYGLFDAWLGSAPLLLRILLSFAPALSLGALLALGLESARGFAPLWRCFGNRPDVAASLVVLGSGLLLGGGWGPPIALDLAFAALVASAVLAPHGWLGRALSGPRLAALGRVSYGVYLVHVPVLGLLRRLFPDQSAQPGLLFPVALALSWGLAALSFRHFEAPLLALARRPRPQTSPGGALSAGFQ
jgi:peptidoglycan/LPS O-acetylase OafA/YrhL